MKVKILFLTLLFIPAFLYAQTTKDTLIVYPSEKFSAKQLILPASLIAVGSWGINNGWFNKINNKIQNKMIDWRDDNYIHIDDYIRYLPVASHLGLGLLGAQAKHSFKERLVITATSYLAMGIIVRSLKLAINEKRPDSEAHNSFPSGHTATVFMGAELVRKEYGIGYGIGAYTIACGVAFLRLYNGRHWFNDVLAGAGIGIITAQLGYWLLPLNRKLFRLNKKNAPTIIACPYYNPQQKTTGGAFALYF